MSDQNFPPGGSDPYGPPAGQPGQPVTEHLQSGFGQPLAAPPKQRNRRRIALVTAGVVTTGALVGGGVFAWNAFFNQGPQPAEALPSTTLAYVSLDLDPTGEQKIEAIKTLRKFPAFRDNVDIGDQDDVREKVFDAMQDDGVCTDLDYDDDVASWLGDRIAAAVIDQGEGEKPAPVVVLQVRNQDDAEKGLDKLVSCGNDEVGGGSSSGFPDGTDKSEETDELGGYAFNGDWVVIAETEKIAQNVVKDAEDKGLTEDEDYQKWTDAVGDPGVVNMYAAPEAGRALTDVLSSESMPTEFGDMLDEFPGGAATIRFEDGNLEMETVTGEWAGSWNSIVSDQGATAMSSLPDTTAVAFGIGFKAGWVQETIDQMRELIEKDSDMSVDEAIAEFESETGLSVPEDIEALGGESAVVAFDGDFESGAFQDEDITRIPVGARIEGDPEKIEAALDNIRAQAGADGDMILSKSVDGAVLVSGNPAYLEKLAEGGNLTDDDTFGDLVPHADDASTVFYVNLDANDGWLDDLLVELEAPQDVRENIEPLKGLGLSSWKDGEELHSLLKVTTG